MQANSQPADDQNICPLPSMVDLKGLMNNQSNISDGMMNEIRRKLKEDAYLTRQAAETTASRMIDNDEL